MSTRTIDGPLGAFRIPSEPPETSRICEGLTRAVWAGEYDHPELPTSGVASVLDVGAGWGAFAVWAHARWGTDLRIDGYDPHHEAIEYLRLNAPSVRVHQVAVTVRPSPRLAVNEDWGGCSVHHDDPGRDVAALHPRELPAADVLKIDAEGVEPEILEHYPHLGRLKALIYEFHHLAHRDAIRPLVARAGLRQVREDQDVTYGTSIWVPA
jgi:FkbM family methyltransferase